MEDRKFLSLIGGFFIGRRPVAIQKDELLGLDVVGGIAVVVYSSGEESSTSSMSGSTRD